MSITLELLNEIFTKILYKTAYKIIICVSSLLLQ